MSTPIDMFDIVTKTKEGTLRSRIGPYDKATAEAIAKASRTYNATVVPHDYNAVQEAKAHHVAAGSR